ncbi:NFACT family protein [Candidatus Micrarchaeota archaeon]|nr:NFACT family protein [Candidatus Micrarchaeota archaeon]
MENLEYCFISNELQKIVGMHLSNFYKVGDGKYRMKIGSEQIILEVGVRLGFAKYLGEALDADNFVNRVKKILDNKKLVKIRQLNDDRIIIFDFDGGFEFIFEGFGKGNIILVENGKNITAFKEEEWADRIIRSGREYKYPKNSLVENLAEVLSDKYVISSMLKLPLGKEYSKEILIRCGVEEKTPGESLKKEEIREIELEIERMKKELKPYLFMDGEMVLDFGLIKFSKYDGKVVVEKNSLSEATEEFYRGVIEKSEEVESLERRLSKQIERLEELKVEEKERKLIGDFIYENYEKTEDIIKKAKKIGIENVESEMKVKTNKKKKEIEIEI